MPLCISYQRVSDMNRTTISLLATSFIHIHLLHCILLFYFFSCRYRRTKQHRTPNSDWAATNGAASHKATPPAEAEAQNPAAERKGFLQLMEERLSKSSCIFCQHIFCCRAISSTFKNNNNKKTFYIQTIPFIINPDTKLFRRGLYLPFFLPVFTPNVQNTIVINTSQYFGDSTFT